MSKFLRIDLTGDVPENNACVCLLKSKITGYQIQNGVILIGLDGLEKPFTFQTKTSKELFEQIHKEMESP